MKNTKRDHRFPLYEIGQLKMVLQPTIELFILYLMQFGEMDMLPDLFFQN
jgi:hypothetical protein